MDRIVVLEWVFRELFKGFIGGRVIGMEIENIFRRRL